MTAPFVSLTGKQWRIRPERFTDPAAFLQALQRARELDPHSPGALPPPEALPGMETAVVRIRQAIERKEQVGIVGDYDCDGITAVAQLVRFFRRHALTPHVRLPHRVHDGYGLSLKMVEEMRDRNVTLLITADTGVTAEKEIAAARAMGMDVIVTDHHMLPATMPSATAIVHPGRSENFPGAHPSGSGVVYQLLRALENDDWEGKDEDTILAAMGTVADLVPLTGGNRLLVRQGLAAFANLRSSPLLLLAAIAGINPTKVTSGDIAFRLAPRINAPGRMTEPDLSLRALLGDMEAMHELDALNSDRQLETDRQLATAMEGLGIARGQTNELPVLLATLHNTYTHGTIGLIAGKLTERTGRPSIAAVEEGETCTASLRSPSVYHIAEGLERHRDLLLRYGGHAQAAGCTLLRANWDRLCSALTADIAERTTPESLVPSIDIDAEITVEQITTEFVAMLGELEPHGQGNREPVFLLRDVRIAGARLVGRDGAHLQGNVAGKKMIGFHAGPIFPHCIHPLDIVFRLGMDEWQGARQPQLMLLDARVHKEAGVRVPDTSIAGAVI
jgi:single-stranded-DNA-specific exonuclease